MKIKKNPNSWFSRKIVPQKWYVELDVDETTRYDAKKYIERFHGDKYIQFQFNPNKTYKVFIIDRKYYIKLDNKSIKDLDIPCYFYRIFFGKEIDRPYHRDIIRLTNVVQIIGGRDMYNPEFHLVVYGWELIYRKDVVTKKNREMLTYQERKYDNKKANLRIFSKYNVDRDYEKTTDNTQK